MTNYFEFYDIDEAIDIDTSLLKQKFYEYSRKYHPDYFTQELDIEREKAQQLSSINNKAYTTLKNLNSRIKHILDIHDALDEEGKNQVPQAFLMEMMDINEIIMELEFDYNADNLDKAKALVADVETSMEQELESLSANVEDEQYFKRLKDYYLKKQYLKRINENLSKLAAS